MVVKTPNESKVRLFQACLRHGKTTFTALVLSGTLTQHLLDIDQAARDQMASLTRQLAANQGVTESLKARDPLAWVRRMNSIRNRAEEVVKNELIYN